MHTISFFCCNEENKSGRQGKLMGKYRRSPGARMDDTKIMKEVHYMNIYYFAAFFFAIGVASATLIFYAKKKYRRWLCKCYKTRSYRIAKRKRDLRRMNICRKAIIYTLCFCCWICGQFWHLLFLCSISKRGHEFCAAKGKFWAERIDTLLSLI